MASMRDIKRRRASIQSTEQITKAMKVVSTVKLQKAKSMAESTRPYFNWMYRTMCSILSKSGNLEHKYLKPGAGGKKAVVAITSNRGLAGGYNNNIVKLVMASSDTPPEQTQIFAIGRKGRDGLGRKGYEVAADYSAVIEEPAYQDAADLTRELLARFEKGEVSEIYLAYTSFKNTVTQVPTLLKLLPVEVETPAEAVSGPQALMNYEPDEEAVLDAIVPSYMSSLIYGALMEAVASENGARMTAMDSATSNAEEMIDKLSLQYNRARQGSITQELTEIIAGANAIS